jgi:hypothetical protein
VTPEERHAKRRAATVFIFILYYGGVGFGDDTIASMYRETVLYRATAAAMLCEIYSYTVMYLAFVYLYIFSYNLPIIRIQLCSK